MYKILIIMFIFLLTPLTANAEPLTLKYFQVDSRYGYHISLLRLAMDLTHKTDGPYRLQPLEKSLSHARGSTSLVAGKDVNIAFLAANKEREEKFLSVKIPILRGLLGYRISIIHKDNADRFSKIQTLGQLKKEFMAGFGVHWADMKILQLNGIPVMGVAKYKNLFGMLSNNRFQYFPRGINEPWKELETRKESHPNLTIEPNIAFYYPYPVYFYVNKQNIALADRVQRGLNIALGNGDFKNLFLKYHQKYIQMSRLNHRKIFKLKNTTLPENTPEPDTSWWMQ